MSLTSPPITPPRSQLLPMPLSFFFQSYGAHPDLHSFPTRRSSDLVVQSNINDLASPLFALVMGMSTALVMRKARSEEHTSELQSQSNLVCRLLLEKKNVEACVTVREGVDFVTWSRWRVGEDWGTLV